MRRALSRVNRVVAFALHVPASLTYWTRSGRRLSAASAGMESVAVVADPLGTTVNVRRARFLATPCFRPHVLVDMRPAALKPFDRAAPPTHDRIVLLVQS